MASLFVCVTVMCWGTMLAQITPEVLTASVRLNKSGGASSMEFLPGGERFVATNVPLGVLVLTAHNLTPPQFSSSSSAQPVINQRFDIHMKAEHALSRDEMLHLLQSVLQNRFSLILRREVKQEDGFALVADRGGPKLRSSGQPLGRESAPINPYHARGAEKKSGHLVFKDTTMAELAWSLTTLVDLQDRVVVDKTGLDGFYDFELKYWPEESVSITGDPSLFVALREQLGLKLEPTKIVLETVKVEFAHAPSGN